MRHVMSDKGTMWEKIGEKDGLVLKDGRITTDETVKKQVSQEWKAVVCLLVLAIPFAVMGFMACAGTGIFFTVDPDEFAIRQDIKGGIKIYDSPGLKIKWFGRVWHYPRYVNVHGDRIAATFNEGSWRGISTLTTAVLPRDSKSRVDLHQTIMGDMGEVDQLIKGVVISAVKATAPIMSGKEILTHRKSEFADLVADQVINGLYKYEITIDANSFTVEIVRDTNGKPITAMKAVFPWRGITIRSFHITDIRIPPDEAKAMADLRAAKLYKMRAKHEAEVAIEEARSAVAIARAKADEEMEKARIEVKKEQYIERLKKEAEVKKVKMEKDAAKYLDQIKDDRIIMIDEDRMLRIYPPKHIMGEKVEDLVITPIPIDMTEVEKHLPEK